MSSVSTLLGRALCGGRLRMRPRSSTVSRALSMAASFALIGVTSPEAATSSLNCKSSMERGSWGPALPTAVTVPRTVQPAGTTDAPSTRTGAPSTATTASPTRAEWLATALVSRMDNTVPAGRGRSWSPGPAASASRRRQLGQGVMRKT